MIFHQFEDAECLGSGTILIDSGGLWKFTLVTFAWAGSLLLLNLLLLAFLLAVEKKTNKSHSKDGLDSFSV